MKKIFVIYDLIQQLLYENIKYINILLIVGLLCTS